MNETNEMEGQVVFDIGKLMEDILNAWELPVVLMSDTAKMPEYKSEGAAGMDLCADEDAVIPPGSRAAIPTGLKMAIPQGYVGEIRPRSGLARDFGIDVLGGIVDSDYRGEVAVILVNHGKAIMDIKQGDRIAQLLIKEVERVAPLRVERLDETKRGDNGFGSTGR